MSKNEYYLSKSIVMAEVLFLNSLRQARKSVVASHKHVFWQIELVREGQIHWLFAGGKKIVSPGQILLLPPGVLHGFEYFDEISDLVSIKFEWNDQVVQPCAGTLVDVMSGPLSLHVQAIFSYVHQKGEFVDSQRAINLMLNAILMHFVQPVAVDEKGVYSKVAKKIKSLDGRRVQVSELAKDLNLSVSHLSREFRMAHGSSLKNYIDANTLAVAQKYLSYTGQSIGEIAFLLGFPDVYSFSHFFKKIRGVSPREFRENG